MVVRQLLAQPLFELALQRDLPELLNKLVPPSREYGHEQMWHDGNGHSHLQATWLGPSLTVSVSEGKLELGTWQQIFHLECDIKPRSAKDYCDNQRGIALIET